MRHRKMVSFISHLIYLLQLPHLGKSQNTKNDQFRRKPHIVIFACNEVSVRLTYVHKLSGKITHVRSTVPYVRSHLGCRRNYQLCQSNIQITNTCIHHIGTVFLQVLGLLLTGVFLYKFSPILVNSH